jgi:hypothetical protein
MAEALTIQFDLGELQRQFGATADVMHEAAAAALFEQGEAIMARSKESFVPVDKGILRGSGFVAPPVLTDHEISVTLGFGGPASAYAFVQHEREDFKHKVGQAKYLERPVMEAVVTLAARIADGVRSALERLSR